MPELASLKPNGLPTTVYQPINPSSYFDRRVPNLTPNTTGASELESQAAISTLVAKAVGDLPNLITTNLLKGGETRNKLAGQKVMGQVLGGQALNPQQRGALADVKIDSSGASSINPESPSDVAYKQAMADRTKQLTINDTPVANAGLRGISGVSIPGQAGTLSDPSVNPALAEQPLPGEEPGALAEPRTGALAPDNRPIWQRDAALAKVMADNGISGEDLMAAKPNEKGELVVTDPDGTARAIPELASSYLMSEMEKEKQSKEAEAKLNSLTGKGALADKPKLVGQIGNQAFVDVPGIGVGEMDVMAKPTEGKFKLISKAPGTANQNYKANTLKLLASSGYVPQEGETEAQIVQNATKLSEAQEQVPEVMIRPFMQYTRSLRSDDAIKKFQTARHEGDVIRSALSTGLNPAAALGIIDSYVKAMRGGAATKGMTDILEGSQSPYAQLKQKLKSAVGGTEANTVLSPELANQIKLIVEEVEDVTEQHVKGQEESAVKYWKTFKVPASVIHNTFDMVRSGHAIPDFDIDGNHTGGQQSSGSPATGQSVKMKKPDGSIVYIPAANVEAAKGLGATVIAGP